MTVAAGAVARQAVASRAAAASAPAAAAATAPRPPATETPTPAAASSPPAPDNPGKTPGFLDGLREGAAQGRKDAAAGRGRSSSGAGLLLAVLAYPAALAWFRGGTPALRQWFAAKWLNRTPSTAGAAPSSTTAAGTTVVPVSAAAGLGSITPAAAYGTLPASTASTGGGAAVAIAFARSQIGKPYRFGGTGPDSWDCSGLVQAAWKAGGVDLPRVVSTQMLRGSAVRKADLRPGDLVMPTVGHIQLYAGGGRVIEAAHTGTNVREVPMWGFLAARRVG